jgi:hypothetical protein
VTSGTAFWRAFDEQVTRSETNLEDATVAQFRQQIKDMGCAVMDNDFDIESATYARLRTGWIKLCRGDKKMEDKFSKVAMLLEEAMQPLLDELAAERKRVDAVLERIRSGQQ